MAEDNKEIRDLRIQLMYEWIHNHFEHCGRLDADTWPCDDPHCGWLLPPALKSLPDEMLAGIFTEANEKYEPPQS
jgi:hypothetical protein